ncbi:MAG TPA: hypothetical protein VEQ58_03880 [Polyangiaceae bacterium]|nr:hypothetical protein [Polyangiaceae bacterium]
MLIWLSLPLFLQGLAMLVDELHFHRRRGLPRWERIGHPVDTLSVLVCYGLSLSVAPSQQNLVIYAVLAALSCLLITKDELVHAARCEPWEQWLHALLFVLHPIVLSVAALLWLRQERLLLALSAALTAGFGAYQFAYWNLKWTKLQRSQSITPFMIDSASVGTPPTTTPSRSCAPNRDFETPG